MLLLGKGCMFLNFLSHMARDVTRNKFVMVQGAEWIWGMPMPLNFG